MKKLVLFFLFFNLIIFPAMAGSADFIGYKNYSENYLNTIIAKTETASYSNVRCDWSIVSHDVSSSIDLYFYSVSTPIFYDGVSASSGIPWIDSGSSVSFDAFRFALSDPSNYSYDFNISHQDSFTLSENTIDNIIYVNGSHTSPYDWENGTISYTLSTYTDIYSTPSATIDGANKTIIFDQATDTLIVYTGNYSASTHNINISIPYNELPDLYYPVNGSTIASEYPSYNTVEFSWEDISSKYIGVISQDEDFETEWYNSTIYGTTWDVILGPGTYYWKIYAYESFSGEYLDPSIGTFSIGAAPSEAGYISISVYDEISGVQLNTFSVELLNDSTVLQKSTTSSYVVFNASEVLAGEYTAKISADDYSPRWRIIDSPENISAYLSQSANNSLIQFALIDYTNLFNYRETRLIITKLGNSGILTISDNYFDAVGLNKVYLANNGNYGLSLLSSEAQRDVGPYIPTVSETTSLVVGDIEIIPDTDVFGNFNYTIQHTNESVSFAWVAPAGSLLSPLTYNITDTDSGLIVYSASSVAPQGVAKYIYPAEGKQYYIQFWASTSGGIISHQEYVRSEENLLDFQISEHWYNMISIFVLMLFGLTFGYRSAPVGAFLTAILAAGLYALGALRLDLSIISFVVILGVLALLRGKQK